MTATLAHISDLHIGKDHDGDGGVRALHRAQRVIDHLNTLQGGLDGVLVTGDIADHGTPDEYRTARELLATLRFPVLTCPGNHDDRVNYQAHLLEVQDDRGAAVNDVHRPAGLTIAMCDSTIPRQNPGLLDDSTLAWLDRVLADAEGPVLVCLHHPPVVLHHPFIDGIRLRNEDQLAEVLRDNVLAVLCGHAHTAAVTTFAGRPLVVAPGVVSTLVLPFESEGIFDYDLPPSVAFHVVDDRGLVTHFRSV
ncbi:metallophosphoesterase [Actinophytocola oryzae]|uniref:3',5'-cyclic AMP phosphodiesterase CpdA n=1 Tax=Actinophytocola oryzae TaxID=502181 RepID=A0A4R7W054_9PSEU|nr:metallophosphoesterase [Actinophytocola oryzae]TDV55435.1 3',5'-cyclic AMP phosphodiesterase CpdA [Actinophytocola oryzae]